MKNSIRIIELIISLFVNLNLFQNVLLFCETRNGNMMNEMNTTIMGGRLEMYDMERKIHARYEHEKLSSMMNDFENIYYFPDEKFKFVFLFHLILKFRMNYEFRI